MIPTTTQMILLFTINPTRVVHPLLAHNPLSAFPFHLNHFELSKDSPWTRPGKKKKVKMKKITLKPTTYNLQPNNGFTLVETLVVIAVFGVVIGMVTSGIVFFYKTNSYVLEQATAINDAQAGIEHTAQDIREATYSDQGTYPINQISGTSLYFYSDIDKDNSVERVKFYLDTDNTTFLKEITKSGGNPLSYDGPFSTTTVKIISKHTRNDALSENIFTYYNNSGAKITDYNKILDVAFVMIKLIVNVNPNRAPSDFELRTSASLRNYVTPID
ncbi:type II secretion system GspH family protein [Patescibacteria group bacterium]|nr:type II secretion system GspH family protein [Patescibacteria group bacterium]